MANQKVSAMTAASALTAAELLHVVQGGADRKATVQQILDAATQAGSVSNRITSPVQKSNDATEALETELTVNLSAGTYIVAVALYAGFDVGGFKASLAAGTAVLSVNPLVMAQSALEGDQLSSYSLSAAGSATPALVTTPTSADAVNVLAVACVSVQTGGTFGVRWAQRVSNPAATELSDGWIAAIGALS